MMRYGFALENLAFWSTICRELVRCTEGCFFACRRIFHGSGIRYSPRFLQSC